VADVGVGIVTDAGVPLYTVEMCDSTWQHQGLLALPDRLTMVDRVCDVGIGSVEAPATPENLELAAAGATVLVRRQDGTVRQAGVLTPFGASQAASVTLKLAWDTPMTYLRDQQAWPNPGTETGQGPQEFDRRTGLVSTVIRGYVGSNIGPGAGWRQAPGLVLGEDQQVGQQVVTEAPRWGNLLELCRTLALPNGVVFELITDDRTHTFQVRQFRDLSDRVVLAAAALGSGSWSRKRPQATRVIVLGQGEGTAQIAVLVTTAESLEQEKRWGSPIVYVHAAQSTDLAVLQAEGLAQLAEKGETVDVTVEVLDSAFGVDFQLGDLVSVWPAGLAEPVVKPVREVTETWSKDDGSKVTPTIGDYQATASTGATVTTRQLQRVVDVLKTNR
jgi:hypothetical protein